MTPEELLEKGLHSLGIRPPENSAASFLTYLSELKKWNRAYNLTALKSDGDIVIKHFLDSALFLKAIEGRGQSVADVGSGAGFPGLPLKILVPSLEVALIEPSRKKASFLRHMIRTLGLKGVAVMETRVEDVRGEFDIALTRALFRAVEFVKRAGHIVRQGGFFVLGKGPRFEEETKGLGRVTVITERLPFTEMERHLVIIEKLR
jgi:16S rRNA (guanine527-N7)-methyltransferase